jgi:hypothetical protein
MKTLPILHVYGQIAHLPWHQRDRVRIYRPQITYHDVARAAMTIKIVSEKKDDNLDKDPDFLRAWELIDGADRLCFLGFGYHETNLERLKIDNSGGDWMIYGTSKGLPESDRKRVRQALRGVELHDSDCLWLLQHLGL